MSFEGGGWKEALDWWIDWLIDRLEGCMDGEQAYN